MHDRVSGHSVEIPRRRAIVDGLLVKFESRDPKLVSIRWHPRFKQRYRSKVDAEQAKRAWEERGRIMFPGDLKEAQPPQPKQSKPHARRYVPAGAHHEARV